MDVLRELADSFTDYQFQWTIILLALACVYLWRKSRQQVSPTRTIEDITMSREGRRLYVNRVVIETLCDGLLDAVIDGKITEDEANQHSAKLAKLYGHTEEIPLIAAKKQAIVKKRLKDNNRRRTLTRSHNGGFVPISPIPEPKDVPNVKPTLESILKGKAI